MNLFRRRNAQSFKAQKMPAVWSIVFLFFLSLYAGFLLKDSVFGVGSTPPAIISYQGKLLNSGTAVDATTTMGFLIYDDLSAGTLLYTASGTVGSTSTVEVLVSESIFSVNLGGSDTNAIADDIFADESGLYLEVWIEGVKMSPRKRLTAAPYAMNSAYLMGYAPAMASTSEYIPRSDSNGNFIFTGSPISDEVSGGTLFINPGVVDANETILGLGVGGVERFRVDEDGDTWLSGNLTATGTATGTFTNLEAIDGITLGGVKQTSWPGGGGGDVTEAGNNDFTGTNTFAATTTFTSTTFSGTATFNTSTTFGATSTMENLEVTDGITLGGVKQTSWPAGGGDVTEAGNNDFIGTNTFAATTTFTSTTFNGTATFNNNADFAGDNNFTGETSMSNVLNLSGKIASPNLSGYIEDVVDLIGVSGFAISGDYLYALAPLNNVVTVVDIASSTNPTVLSTASLNASGSGFGSIAMAGNYVYTIMGGSGRFEVTDVSNPAQPVVVGILTITSGGRDIFIAGNYAYIAGGFSDRVTIVDISNPRNPVLASTLTHNAAGPLLDDPYSIVVSGNYAYVAAQTSDAFTVIDVSDPRTPTFVTSTIHGGSFVLNGARSVAVSGKYAYVGSETSDALQIIDISDVANPIAVANYTGAGSALWSGNDVYAIFPTDKYLYIKAGAEFFILDISNPSLPSLVEERSVGIANTAENAKSISVYGNKMVISDYGSNTVLIYDISGASITHADIGSANVADLHIRNNLETGGQVNIKGGLNVGNNGFLLNGNFSMFAPTSSLNATNTLRFSHTALFETMTSSTDTHAFVFNTANTLTLATTTYLFSLRNNGTPTFSVSTNGSVITTGTYYGAAVSVGTPGTPGDLAERVDIAFGDSVEPGDVVVVDPNETDTYRRSTSAYAQEVSGVISTNPTIVVGNGRTENTAVMAMVGRVPIKVITENGPIRRGDLLVTASTTGYAMRYDPTKDNSGRIAGVIGVALESLGAGQGKIMGLVRTGWVNNKQESLIEIQDELRRLSSALGVQSNLQSELSVGEDSDGNIVSLQDDLDAKGFSLLNVKSIQGAEDRWQIDETGRLVTNVDTRDGQKTLYAMQSGEDQFVFSGTGVLNNGETRIDFEEYILDVIDTTKPMSVNLTLTAPAEGIYVEDKDETGFDVKELSDETSDATFDWVVIASRKLDGDVSVEEVPVEEPEEEVVAPAEDEVVEEVPNEEPGVEGDEPVEEVVGGEEEVVVEELVEEEVVVEEEEQPAPAPEEVVVPEGVAPETPPEVEP